MWCLWFRFNYKEEPVTNKRRKAILLEFQIAILLSRHRTLQLCLVQFTKLWYICPVSQWIWILLVLALRSDSAKFLPTGTPCLKLEPFYFGDLQMSRCHSSFNMDGKQPQTAAWLSWFLSFPISASRENQCHHTITIQQCWNSIKSVSL